MKTKKLDNGGTLTTSDRNDNLFQGLAWAPYSPLYLQSKPYTQHHFFIVCCSLIEYIGVEWCVRIPDNEKLAYMKRVFDTLASVGNDKAAKDAFQILKEIFHWHELHRRCVRLAFPDESLGDKDFSDIRHDKKHPYYPSRNLVGAVYADIRHEFLDFIRERFWMMPLEIPDAVRAHCNRLGNMSIYATPIALVETRKEMIRACIERWNGTPGDQNDEAAFSIFSAMANPWHGGCKVPENKPNWVKELCDVVLQELRETLVERVYRKQQERGVEIDWKYWMTRDKYPAQCEAILNVFAKTRAALGGYKEALLDMKARQEIKEMEDLLKNTKKFS